MVAQKFDAETSKDLVQQLIKLGGNVNQIAKYFNERRQHNEDHRFFDLERKISIIRKEIKEIWQKVK
ncbi:plasmid mobilization relaxosome protein MobC, partial [Staphylococcus aureus]|uniref:plasmid mobilization relaxosome protein MobC n=1 Tax=Staphylococcus aureus TaxID=1280 RepID=UPI00289672D4